MVPANEILQAAAQSTEASTVALKQAVVDWLPRLRQPEIFRALGSAWSLFGDVSQRDSEKRTNFSKTIVQMLETGGLPLQENGFLDIRKISSIDRRLEEIARRFPESMRLSDLADPDFLEAVKLSGLRDALSPEDTKHMIEILQKIGCTPDMSLAEVSSRMGERAAEILQEAFKRPDLWDLPEAVKKQLVEDFSTAEESFDQKMYSLQDAARKENGRRRSEEYAAQRQKEDLNEEAVEETEESEDTPGIQCVVQETATRARDGDDARAFEIIPVDRGMRVATNVLLTRMHIQHLRQRLWQDGVLDNFEPAAVRVEDGPEGGLRISTTDEEFADYLEGNREIKIPNRMNVDSADTAEQEISKQDERSE